MFSIVEKRRLNDSMTLMSVEAPFIAKKAQAGQFIILRVNEYGERIPLTIADYDREKGTVTIIYQKVGGGAGCAIAYPQAKALHNMGAQVDVIAGFRNKDIIILEDEMRAVCDQLYLMTDDGSNGHKGFVTAALEDNIKNGANYDFVVAIGPLPMMRAVCNLTKEYNIETMISMNPIMIDGTGMCGGCRLTVGGKTKFACVDGPDFNGHEVDFDEAMKRLRTYREQEQEATREFNCRLMEGAKNA